MIIKRDHPLLRGCRIFTMPTGRGLLNLMGKTAATRTGSPLASRQRQWPAHTYTRATPDSWTLAGANTYGLTGRSITLAARIRATTTPPLNGDVFGIICCRQNTPPSTTAGFLLSLNNGPVFSEPSFVFAVFGNDGSLNFFRLTDPAAVSAYVGKSITVVGRWNHAKQTATLFVNGKRVAQSTSGAGTWDTRETTNIKIGTLNTGTHDFNGDIGWTMIYDRAISDGEAYELMDDTNWPFARDYDLVYPGGGNTFSTTIGVRSLFSRVGVSRTFTTRIEALSDLDGDMSGGGETGNQTFRTTIGVRTSMAFAPPLLRLFRTTVGMGSTVTISKQGNFSASMGCRTKLKRTINGRVDLIGTTIYRR